MKYEIVCRDCGQINRAEIPLVSKKDGLDLNCFNCENLLITFFHDEHYMGIAITQFLKNIGGSKVVKT